MKMVLVRVKQIDSFPCCRTNSLYRTIRSLIPPTIRPNELVDALVILRPLFHVGGGLFCPLARLRLRLLQILHRNAVDPVDVHGAAIGVRVMFGQGLSLSAVHVIVR
jgi:hypothetical protein